MEEDLEHFLRSRDVPNEDIMRMQRDKVDKAVLSIMTDEQMARYITSYGDRVAVLSFCQQTKCSTDKDTLIQRLRDKIGARKMKSKTKGVLCGTSGVFQKTGEGMARQKNAAGEKTTRKIEIGWLHFGSDEYHQVRTSNGGGTRHATVEKKTTVAQILEMGKDLFFPDGQSTKGRADEFTFDICDFKRNKIPFDETVGRLYEKSKLKLLRFYICTKQEEPSTDRSSCEEGECIEDSLSEDLSGSITEGADSQLTKDGSRIDADDSITDLPDHTYSSDSDNSEQNLHFQMQPRSKKQRAISETVTAQGPGKSHPPHSTDIKQTLIGQGQDSNARDDDDDKVWNHFLPSNDFLGSCFEIIDLTSAVPNDFPQTEPEHMCHDTFEDVQEVDEVDTIAWDPEDDLGGADGDETVVITFNYVNNEDVIQQDSGLDFLPQDLPLNSSSQLPPSASASNPGNPLSPRSASICRIKVVEDLLAVFMDSSIMNLTLKMDFINEKAIDDAGVSREVYTAFWEQFLEQCEGETERVPRLGPDFCEAEWQAVGRIWVKGLLDYGVMPVRLSKAFILACVHGIDSVDADILMTSFLNYLPPVERSAVEKALQGTTEESDEEDLLDLFTRMGSHFLPPKNSMKPAIESMAHKAILQEPKYIVDCFSTPMSLVQLKLSNKESLLSLYESKKATGKRVLQLFETTKVVLSPSEQSTFNHLQRYVKNADQTKAEKILRFCTGSSVICVDKILICFNAETGLNRRPVAHTCEATLEVPCTYTSYPEFRTEFDNILSSNYFEMDIL